MTHLDHYTENILHIFYFSIGIFKNYFVPSAAAVAAERFLLLLNNIFQIIQFFVTPSWFS